MLDDVVLGVLVVANKFKTNKDNEIVRVVRSFNHEDAQSLEGMTDIVGINLNRINQQEIANRLQMEARMAREIAQYHTMGDIDKNLKKVTLFIIQIYIRIYNVCMYIN